MGKIDGYSIGNNEQNFIKVKTPESMDVDELVGNREAITLMLWIYQRERYENKTLKTRLDDELKNITTTQVENIKGVILPLLPKKESLWKCYFHGSFQSMIGAIFLPIVIGILLFAINHSLNDLWAVLGEFFTSLSKK